MASACTQFIFVFFANYPASYIYLKEKLVDEHCVDI